MRSDQFSNGNMIVVTPAVEPLNTPAEDNVSKTSRDCFQLFFMKIAKDD
jgi:hypothetical protein